MTLMEEPRMLSTDAGQEKLHGGPHRHLIASNKPGEYLVDGGCGREDEKKVSWGIWG